MISFVASENNCTMGLKIHQEIQLSSLLSLEIVDVKDGTVSQYQPKCLCDVKYMLCSLLSFHVGGIAYE